MTSPSKQIPSLQDCGRRRVVAPGKPRSLPVTEWPESDRLGWRHACEPNVRLKRGGSASRLCPVSQADIANRYGLYLDFLRRKGMLDQSKGVAALVTPANVDAFLVELKSRVRSVTV